MRDHQRSPPLRRGNSGGDAAAREFLDSRGLLKQSETGSIDMNEQSLDETVSHSQSVGVRPPRVWTVFAVLGLALILGTLLQAGLAAVLGIIELSRGVRGEELREVVVDRLTSPYIFILMIAAGQLANGLAVFLAAFWSPELIRERVGWRKAQPGWHVYAISMLGSIFPLAIGLTAAEALTNWIPADESLLKFFNALTIDSWIVFVLFAGIAPGLCEEVLFRGYMQQRLVRRWGVATGIVVTSILFGLLHISPHAISATLLLGFWFGYLAWRSDSILPGVMCHFFVNSGTNMWRMIIKFGELSEATQNSVHVCLMLIGVICFAVCCRPAFWRKQA